LTLHRQSSSIKEFPQKIGSFRQPAAGFRMNCSFVRRVFMRFRHPVGKRILAVIILLGAAVLMPRPAAAIAPEDPKVKEVVKKALGYLSAQRDERIGGECLIGLCFWKAGEPAEHPKIQRALARCQGVNFQACDNYSLGIALMFLCEIDPELHHDLIAKYTTEMFRRQKTFGGWSYESFQTGDTSQTQYAVLGMWMVKNFCKNIEVPIDRIEGCGGWLMRTQDPSGKWGYQGQDPGTLARIPQNSVSTTLAASGSGSMYMIADLLQVTRRVDVPHAQRSAALLDPEAGKKAAARGPLTETLKPDDIKNTLAAADKALGFEFEEQHQWHHYYMYALERYHSFREKAGGERNNRWYDQGYEYLRRTQQADGSWVGGQGSDNTAICTCFGTLFLLRSSQKVISKKMAEGVAVGGRELPKDVRNLTVTSDAKVIDPGLALNTDQILEMINNGKSDEIQRIAEENEALALSSNKSERRSQIETLRKQVGAGDYNVRKIVVTALGKDRDLKNVPQLLYAMTDPDPRIGIIADKGLRFISRKIAGVGLPDSNPTKDQIIAARAAWRDWYLSIRPDAELIE
jgi:hypothetical protein